MISLLLNINPDPGHSGRLANAIALVRNLGGHITCLQVLTLPTVGDGSAAVVVTEAADTIERAAQEFREEVEVQLDQAGVEWGWIRLFGDAAASIVRYSRLADLILLGNEESYPSVAVVAPYARAPVLVLSQESKPLSLSKPALLAWNGSQSTANALRDAVSLLHHMEPVHILAVNDENEEFPAARALEYLSHHAIRSEVHLRRAEGKITVADAIVGFAQEVGTELIVAGAFGHNLLREMLLGSVTRGLLKSRHPLFLAH